MLHYLPGNLKKYRILKNLTQENAAEYLRITPQSVSKWERGESYPDITFLPALANMFETSVDLLIGMDTMNIRNIEKITGHKGGKIKMLLEYAGSLASVIDPWYSRRFDDTYRDIVTGCTAFMEYLKKEGKI